MVRSSDLRQRVAKFWFSELMVHFIHWKEILWAFITVPDEFWTERATRDACNSNFVLGNHLSICLKTEENQETWERDGQSHGLPDAHWLAASGLAKLSKLHLQIECLPHRKHFSSISKTSRLTQFGKIIVIYWDSYEAPKYILGAKYIVPFIATGAL
jgi:hypothetical protein